MLLLSWSDGKTAYVQMPQLTIGRSESIIMSFTFRRSGSHIKIFHITLAAQIGGSCPIHLVAMSSLHSSFKRLADLTWQHEASFLDTIACQCLMLACLEKALALWHAHLHALIALWGLWCWRAAYLSRASCQRQVPRSAEECRLTCLSHRMASVVQHSVSLLQASQML